MNKVKLNKQVSKKPETLSNEDWQEVRSSRTVRMRVAKKDLYWFFHLYFGHYISHETADFQKEIFKNISDKNVEHLVVVAFRGSGKSTVVSTAYPIWSIIGEMQKKYVVIVSQTQSQAQQHLRNLRAEIESNELFRNDFGNLEEETNEWGISALAMPKLGAKIVAVSREQGVRGLRSGPHRPDLVISDDVEDTQSVKTQESRNKTYHWFTSEIVPIGDQNTKYVTVGNLLHEDSLLMRLKDGFNAGTRIGKFLEYPIMKGKKSLWPGAYPDLAAIDKQRRKIGNRIAWEREYMLRIIPDEDQIITKSMIKTYETMPDRLRNQDEYLFASVDLAISKKEWADYTAIVRLVVRGYGDKRKIYVQPNPLNKRLGFTQTIDAMTQIKEDYPDTKFFVESTGYQGSIEEVAKAEGFDVTGIKPKDDKRARLNIIANKIERGIVVFPKEGAELLIQQITGFGVEKHDDLLDALTMAIIEISKGGHESGRVYVAKGRIGGSSQPRPGSRSYWSRRLDDWDESTNGKWGGTARIM